MKKKDVLLAFLVMIAVSLLMATIITVASIKSADHSYSGKIIQTDTTTEAISGNQENTAISETVSESPDASVSETEKQKKVQEIKGKYVTETLYDGSKDIPKEVFDVPFALDKEMYIPNNYLYETMDETSINNQFDYAEKYINLIYGNSVNRLKDNPEGFYEECELFSLDSEGSVSQYGDDATVIDGDSRIQKILEAYVDNNITSSCIWQTDKSLICFNVGWYEIRGVMTLTVTSTDQDKKAGDLCKPFRDLFGIELYYGKPIRIMVDIGLVNNAIYHEALRYVD